jgi:hypothetical protein
MNILGMLSIITVVTLLATWFNDNISTADYIADEGN